MLGRETGRDDRRGRNDRRGKDDRRGRERWQDADVRRLWRDVDVPQLRREVDVRRLLRDVDLRHLQQDANVRRLRKYLPYVAALGVGVLLAGRRRSEASPLEAVTERDPLEIVTEAAPLEVVTERDPVSEVRQRLAAVGTDEEVAALSPPTADGMPMLGFGTPQDATYDEYFDSVREALRLGYRHVDATEKRESYYNEEAVGDAIARVRTPREELFVTTKVDPADLAPSLVRTSAKESLRHFGLDYVDLLYVHWPTGTYDPDDTLGAFAELRREGLVEHVGVSNFTVDLLEEAVEASPAPIFANQVEMHPLLPQTDLQKFCSRGDVDVELVAYYPTAQGRVEEVDEIRTVADKHDATPAQVSLAWLREKGVTALPDATSTAHLRENWLSLAIDLDPEDVETIDDIDRRERLVDPDDAPWNR